MKKLVIILTTFIIALTGCGKTVSREVNPEELVINGDYVVPPTSHSNPFIGGYIGLEAYTYDYLVMYSPNSEDKYVNHLAEDVKQSEKEITISIRDDIKWSNGEKITTEDVKNSFNMWVGKKQVWEYLDTIEVINEKDIKFKFMVDSPLMLNLIADVPIAGNTKLYGNYAKQYEDVAKTGRKWHPETNSFWYTEEANITKDKINAELEKFMPPIEDAIYSGPFTINSVTTSEALLLKNENFYNEIGFNTMKIIRVITPETAASAIVDGTLDIHSGGMNTNLNEEVTKKLGTSYQEFYIPEYSQMSVIFNLANGVGKDKEFRHAFGYLLDRETMLSVAEIGSLPSETTATGLPLSLQKQYNMENFADNNVENYSFDPQKAEEILLAANYKKNDAGLWEDANGSAIKFELVCNSGWTSAVIPATALVEDLVEFGFDVQLVPMEPASYDEYLRASNHSVAIEFAPPGNVNYAHPYGSYEQLYKGRSWLFGLQPNEKGELLLENKEGEMVDVIALTNKLFTAKDKELETVTSELMSITANNYLFIPYLEKGFPIRVLKEEIHFDNIENSEMVANEKFSYVDQKTFSRLITEGNLKTSEAGN